LGNRASGIWDYALAIGDVSTPSYAIMDTQIEGDILTGPNGFSERIFRGRTFTGEIDGEVTADTDFEFPFYPQIYHEYGHQSLSMLEDFVDHSPIEASLADGMFNSDIIYIDHDLYASELNLLHAETALRIIVSGSIFVDEEVEVASGSEFAAEGPIHFYAGIGNAFTTWVSMDSIYVNSAEPFTAQLISNKSIRVENSWLTFPSALVVTDIETNSQSLNITIANNSRIEGTIAMKAEHPIDLRHKNVVIDDTSIVVGGVYVNGRLDQKGEVHGSVLTMQYFWSTPTTAYVNWLSDVSIRHSERPDLFITPFGLSDDISPEIMVWRLLN